MKYTIVLLFSILIYSCEQNQKHLFLSTDNAHMLKVGEPILRDTTIIGVISGIDLINHKPILTLELEGSIKLPRSAKFRVSNIDLFHQSIKCYFEDSSGQIGYFDLGDTIYYNLSYSL